MASSPVFDSQGMVRFTVQCDGKPLKSTYQLVSFVVNRQVNRIGKAELVFKASVQQGVAFDELDDDLFLPGTEISLAAGYGEEEENLFVGTVIAVQLSINEHDGLQFVVECRDYAYPMTQVAADVVYEDQSDSDIITAVLANYGALQATVQAVGPTQANSVQFSCTDWDFVRNRARANGAVIIVEDKKISVMPPTLSGDAELRITYGLDMIDFQAELSAAKQPASVEARAWDANTQALLVATSNAAALNDQGNVTTSQLAEATHNNTRHVNAAIADNEALQAQANAEQLWAGLSRIVGTCTFTGSAKARIGELIELAGVGSRFNGLAYLGGVEHHFSDAGWTTTAFLGLPQDDPTTATAQHGAVPSQGLQIGVVTQIEEDPRAENRIAIELPLLEQSSTKLWARLASSWASDAYGALCVPDVGDEVVVGFQQGDPAQAIVLGSLYSSKRAPHQAWDQENNWHGLQTKSGITIGLDDKEQAIQVETPGGIKILANDDKKSLTMEDMNGNKLSFSSDGIQLEAAKEITIKAQAGININAGAKLAQSGKTDVSIQGMNVAVKADASASVKGSASAELSATGQTVVKGAMVMIN